MAENQDSNQTVFLATTAINAFWDTTKKMVFLADGCLMHEYNDERESLNYEVLPSPYCQEKSNAATLEFINTTYETLLPQVATILNCLHKLDLSLKSWRIIIGPWLSKYVSVIYDRLLHINNAYNLYPEIETTTLDESCFITCSNTKDFTLSVNDDSYNLQLFSQLINAKGYKYNTKKYEITRRTQNTKLNFMHRLVRRGSSFMNKVSASFTKDIVLRNSYFPRRIEFRYVLKHFGKIYPSLHRELLRGDAKLNEAKRQMLLGVSFGETDFEKHLSTLLY
ncbi:hypothetical protein N9S07_02355, partial [Nitrosomonadales bacterium]|nr:hypothetical protein [Nitrosomonadales bacterium]